jgi:hypothetical protein
MHHRSLLIAVVLAPFLLAGCGGGASGSDASQASTRSTSTAKAGTPEATRAKVSVGAFADTPELEDCMTKAGFAKDAPPTGGLAAWRGPNGARAVVGSGSDVTVGIASEIGTAEHPADVEGTVVIAGPDAPAKAAASCLADVAG